MRTTDSIQLENGDSMDESVPLLLERSTAQDAMATSTSRSPLPQSDALFQSAKSTPKIQPSTNSQNAVDGHQSADNFAPSTTKSAYSSAAQLGVPSFGAASGTDFMAAFAAKAQKTAEAMDAENKAKRKAEEFDSDEDDEAEYDRRVEEEDRAKRTRIQEAAKSASGFTPSFSSTISATNGTPAGDARADIATDGDGALSSKFGSPAEPRSAHEADGVSNDEDSSHQKEYEDDSEDHNDIQAAIAKSYAKEQTPSIDAPEGRSLFDRISKPDAESEKHSKADSLSAGDQSAQSVAPAGPPGTGLFGSRPSTPNPATSTAFGTSLSGGATTSSPTMDNTWKPGSAIKFGSAPSFNFTAATPLAKSNISTNGPLGAVSGTSSSAFAGFKADDQIDTANAVPSFFGQTQPFGGDPKKTAVSKSSAGQVGFGFGGPEKSVSPFLAPNSATSASTSRNTSPGLTDRESAGSGGEDQGHEPQSDLMASRPGEENEELIYQVRTKALEPMTAEDLAAAGSAEEAGYKTRGLGPLRILKHAETGRTRIVMRADPTANVVINAPLLPDGKYDIQRSGKDGASIKLRIYRNGGFKSWVLKIKNVELAQELVDHLKRNEPEAPSHTT